MDSGRDSGLHSASSSIHSEKIKQVKAVDRTNEATRKPFEFSFGFSSLPIFSDEHRAQRPEQTFTTAEREEYRALASKSADDMLELIRGGELVSPGMFEAASRTARDTSDGST